MKNAWECALVDNENVTLYACQWAHARIEDVIMQGYMEGLSKNQYMNMGKAEYARSFGTRFRRLCYDMNNEYKG